MTASTRHRRPGLPGPTTPGVPAVAAVALGLVAVVALAGCGATAAGSGTAGAGTGPAAATSATPSAAPTAPVLGRVGALQIAAGYVPQPASPDVAAAYLTIVNTGSSADTLVAASSDAGAHTSMHRTEGGQMIMIDSLPVPAGAATAFTPGADHLMLEGLTRSLVKGGRVSVTLTFATAGPVTVTLPITGYPTGGGLPSDALTPVTP